MFSSAFRHISIVGANVMDSCSSYPVPSFSGAPRLLCHTNAEHHISAKNFSLCNPEEDLKIITRLFYRRCSLGFMFFSPSTTWGNDDWFRSVLLRILKYEANLTVLTFSFPRNLIRFIAYKMRKCMIRYSLCHQSRGCPQQCISTLNMRV